MRCPRRSVRGHLDVLDGSLATPVRWTGRIVGTVRKSSVDGMWMADQPYTRSSDASRRPHVLIVSDDTGLSSFLNDGLVMAGCWASVVASGLQVLEVFRLRTFELAVIDVALGGLGASELIRRLGIVDDTTGLPRSDIPLLVIAERDDEVAAAGIDPASVDSVVLAPIEIEDLALRIYATVRRWRLSHPERPWSDDAAQARPDI